MISKSPFGDQFEYVVDLNQEARKINNFISGRKTVVVQGLGFVGSAMVVALSNARDEKDNLIFNVIGVDLSDEKNYWKIARVNLGKPPVLSTDKRIDIAYQKAYKNRNLLATYSEYAYSIADVVIIDIQLDIRKKKLGSPYEYDFSYDPFKRAIKVIANNISENTLLVIETTVPPGTTEKIIYPIFKEAFKKRKLNINKLYFVYSYERVMPGAQYLDSLINFYRVYSGINEESKNKAKEFFESFINTRDFPLCELHSTIGAEMSKVLENSFRAMNIAFIQEWTEYAERTEINLFEVIEAIRMRPTHKNIMSPGFGVGGYCLPKDTLFADWSFVNLFNGKRCLEMSIKAISTNDLMPDYTFKLLKQKVKNLKGKHIAILGISYLNDVADTRFSPTEYFFDKCLKEGALINLHDPLVTFWEEKGIEIDSDINHLKTKSHNIAVFAVRHKEYLDLSSNDILSFLPDVKIIVDANNIVNDDVAKELSQKGVVMIGVGKGHWKRLRENNG